MATPTLVPAALAAAPRDGTAAIEGDAIRYSPDAGFAGVDRFTYTVEDGRGGTDTAQVSVAVTTAGTPPSPAEVERGTAGDDVMTLGPSATHVGLAGNDTYLASRAMQENTLHLIEDGAGATTVQIVEGAFIASALIAPEALELTFAGDATVRVLDATGVTFDVGGNVTTGQTGTRLDFPAFVEDVLGARVPASGFATGGPAITAGTATAQPPVAADDAATVAEDATVAIDLLANDSDPQGQPLTLDGIDTRATQGSVAPAGGGRVTYDPDGAFDFLEDGETATDSFAYTVSDPDGNTATALVTVTVEGVTPPPTATTVIDSPGIYDAAVAGETFGLRVDNGGVSGGAITNPDFGGTATIANFDPADDALLFLNEPGSTVTAAQIESEAGVAVIQDPIAETVSYIFEADPGVPGTEGATLTIEGVDDPDLLSIDVA